MKTPEHLKGLLSVIVAVEEACEGTKYFWVLQRDERGGYFGNIVEEHNYSLHFHHASTPTEALMRSLQSFNLRSK